MRLKNKQGGDSLALTPKQEKYVQGLVAGLSQRQAYIGAYPNAKNWKESTVDSRASETLKNSKVLGRYNELMNEHKEKALWTREDAVNTLKWLLAQSVESVKSEEFDKGYVRQGTAGAIINAIQELNKLEDIYPDKDQSITLNGAVSFIDDIS
jgi:phage terminase small subunit